MPAQPSSNSFAAGRSPGRLRTKTSDLSDILHGRTSSSKPSDSDTPPVPISSLATPTKSKGKLAGFLARKRKSGGIALSGGHDASAKEEDGTDTEHYPAIPQSLAASRIPSANQPSLPPLNVSPTSFGASFTAATEPSQPSRFSTDPASLLSVAPTSSATKHRSAIPFRGIKSQKSTSFEVSRPFNVTHTATATNLAMVNGNTSRIPSAETKSKSSSIEGTPSKKPTITISAPPSTRDIEEDKNIYNSPRAAPAPPSKVSSSSTPVKSSRASKDAHGVARKFGFGHHRKDKEELSMMSDPERSTTSKQKGLPVASPTPSLSPMLPPKMHFPIPPKSTPLAPGGVQIVPTLTDAFQSLSPATSSLATVSPHTATASDMSEGELSPSSSKGPSAPSSRAPRPTSLIIPSPNRSRANSANTISSTLTARSPPESPSSPTPTHNRPAFPPSSRIRGASTSTNASGNRISTQHYSYSARSTNSAASPTSPPPMSPLPSPPVSTTSFPGGALSSGEEVEAEVEAGWSTDASTRLGHGGWSTDASTRVGSFGGSLANMKKAALVGAGESRVRANTITTTSTTTATTTTTTTTSTTNGVQGQSQRAGTSTRHPHPHLPHPTPASTYRQHASGVSSGEETNYESAASGRSILAGRKKTVTGLSSRVTINDSTESIVGRPRAASQSSTQRDLPPLPAAADSSDSTTPTKEEPNVSLSTGVPSSSGLKVAHETFVRILQEKHAAEKAELMRRIERLEREARKREREIKGLRWLVMNPSGGGAGTAAAPDNQPPAGGSIGQPYVTLLALEEQLTVGRLRSGSKSSELSGMSGTSGSTGTGSDTTRSRTSSGAVVGMDPSVFFSPADSTEEGLMELQSEVSDFIAPVQLYSRGVTPPSDVGNSHSHSHARGSEDRQKDPRRDSSGSRRRSNTVPDREAAVSATAKHVRRTSSPLLPAGHGLGIVDADLPSIPSGSDMSLTTLGGAASGSIPSLCLSSTNSTSSSGLSLATKSSANYNANSSAASRQSPEPATKERRVSKLLKRISTSSVSSSSLSASSSSYGSGSGSGVGMKMRTSPSIEQVLDRVAEVRASPMSGEARMDEALRRLRRFGGEGK